MSLTSRRRALGAHGRHELLLVALAQIGFDDLGVPLDLGRGPLRDPRPVVEHGDPVRDPHHHFHVVLDQQHRQTELAAQEIDELGQDLGLARIHPGGRLVQEEELRLGGERAGDLEPALVPVREILRQLLILAAKPDELEQLQGPRPGAALFRPHARRPEDRPRHRRREPRVLADQDVVEDRHVLEEPDGLERPGDATSHDRVGAEADDALALEEDLSLVGGEQARDHVEEGRLPGPVRADQAHDRAGGDDEIDLVDRDEAPEGLGHAASFEQGPAAGSGRARQGGATRECSRPAGSTAR